MFIMHVSPLKSIQNIQNALCNKYGVKLGNDKRKKSGKFLNKITPLGITLGSKNKSKGKIECIWEPNEIENKTYQNFGGAIKIVHRGNL